MKKPEAECCQVAGNVLVLNSNFLQGKVLISAEKLLIVADNDGRKLENVEKLLKNDGRIGKR